MTITWLRYDWKEQPTLDAISKALEPHGLIVKEFQNGDEYEFVVCSPDETDDRIIDTIKNDFDEDDWGMLADMLVSPKPTLDTDE